MSDLSAVAAEQTENLGGKITSHLSGVDITTGAPDASGYEVRKVEYILRLLYRR